MIKGGKTEVHSIEDAMKQIQTSGLSKKQMMEAEIVHDILVKQMLTDRMRTKLIDQIQYMNTHANDTTTSLTNSRNQSVKISSGTTTAMNTSTHSNANTTANDESSTVTSSNTTETSTSRNHQPRLTVAQKNEINSNFLTSDEIDWLQLDRLLNVQYYNNLEINDTKTINNNNNNKDSKQSLHKHKLNFDSLSQVLHDNEDDDEEDYMNEVLAVQEQTVIASSSTLSMKQRKNKSYYHDGSYSQSFINNNDDERVWKCPYTTRDELLAIYRSNIN